MQDRPVLLVSDRREGADRLARGIGVVLTCHLIAPGSRLPVGLPAACMIDVARESGHGAWLDRLGAWIRDEGIPCLFLSRDGGSASSEETRRFGTPMIVSGKVHSSGIVTTLLRMVEARRATVHEQRKRRIAEQVFSATSIVKDLFEDAAADRAPSAIAAEKGSEIVLETVSEVGIRNWLDLVWRHDIQVYQHSLGVAGYAAAFGVRLGFSGRDQHRLVQAALLHDVGKACIPIEILHKPGPLTATETQVMRTHAAHGADLLAREGAFETVIVDVARDHHERLDGSGYPRGLTGRAIGDMARLVAICDVHSALTERRVYRPPMPGAQAHAIMKSMSGQLDPDLLRAYAPIVEVDAVATMA